MTNIQSIPTRNKPTGKQSVATAAVEVLPMLYDLCDRDIITLGQLLNEMLRIYEDENVNAKETSTVIT